MRAWRTLAKQFSQDPSATKGGALRLLRPVQLEPTPACVPDVGTVALNTFPTTPQYIDYNSATYALFVAVTKRTATPFAEAARRRS